MAAQPDSKRKPMLGCVADDVTGATDLAINLVHGGMSVVQVIGVPAAEDLRRLDTDAIVVALKTRSIASSDAISQSVASLDALRAIGVERFFFKYCSTFDSTEKGNIGPVAEAMMEALDVAQTIFCPALPRNGRTVYAGHLFVKGRLLNESGMESHPLNPMTDPDLVRFLGKQAGGQTGLLSYEAFSDGSEGVRRRLRDLANAGVSLVVTDSCDDKHLEALARAVTDMKLVTGGSGLARYLPRAYRNAGLLDSPPEEPALPSVSGRSLIMSGSCSTATNQQVAWMKERCPAWKIDIPATIRDHRAVSEDILSWASIQDPSKPLLVYSTAPPAEVAEMQDRFGKETVTRAVEDLQAFVASRMVDELGVRCLVLAGGETAGAITNRLGIRSLRIGPEISAGVPWTVSMDEPALALALKSGNFGEEDFFEAALRMLS